MSRLLPTVGFLVMVGLTLPFRLRESHLGSGTAAFFTFSLKPDSLETAQKRKLNERLLLTNALSLQTTALLSFADLRLLVAVPLKLPVSLWGS